MAAGAVREPDHWTFEAMQKLLEPGARYEVVDGSITMTPTPGVPHEAISAFLRWELESLVRPARTVIGPITVDMDPTFREPDLVVVDRQVLLTQSTRLAVTDVRLAIEIVSSASRTTDRITKPAEYAAAGIPAYWRVEIEDGVAITAYALRDGDTVYTELGTWSQGQKLSVTEPFDVEIAIDDLVP